MNFKVNSTVGKLDVHGIQHIMTDEYKFLRSVKFRWIHLVCRGTYLPGKGSLKEAMHIFG